MSHTVFLRLLNMGLTASYVALAVMVLRLVFRKAPAWLHCALWSLVGLRLVCPFTLKSVVSLIPSSQPIPSGIETAATPAINSGIGFLNSAVNPVLSQTMAPNLSHSINPMQVAVEIGMWIWLAGGAAMLLYGLISTLRLRRTLRERIPFASGVYLCDAIPTPFVLGVFRPKIYLPSHLSREDAQCVIAHEQAHIQRLDHLWKPLGFLLLTLYWFNPVLWLAYLLLCRDMEFACDQRAVKTMDPQQIKRYSSALLNCTTGRRFVLACPLASCESGVKGRIKAILSRKKPAFWLVITALTVSLAVGICFLTDPPVKKATQYTQLGAGTQLEGVSVSLAAFDLTGAIPTLQVEWENQSAKQLTLTEEFYIYRLEEDQRIDARLDPDGYAWTLTATLVGSHFATQKPYFLYDMALPQGIYQFETTFSHTDDVGRSSSPVYRAWIRFRLHQEVASSIIGGVDQPTDITVDTQSPLQFRVGDDPDATPFMDGSHVSQVTTYVENEQEMVRIDLTQAGAALLAKTTHQQVGNTLSVWLDGSLMFSPQVVTPINNGSFVFHRAAISKAHFERLMALSANKNANLYFTAAVEEVLPKSMLVTVTDPGTSGLAGKVSVSTQTLSSGSKSFTPGQIVRVVYNGEVQETYPPTLSTVFAIYTPEELDAEAAVTYQYLASPDPAAPTLRLWEDSRQFTFFYSAFSSSIITGTYTETDEILKCVTDQGGNVYVFVKKGNSLTFDAVRSTAIPQYRYQSGAQPVSPVPDGATFQPAEQTVPSQEAEGVDMSDYRASLSGEELAYYNCRTQKPTGGNALPTKQELETAFRLQLPDSCRIVAGICRDLNGLICRSAKLEIPTKDLASFTAGLPSRYRIATPPQMAEHPEVFPDGWSESPSWWQLNLSDVHTTYYYAEAFPLPDGTVVHHAYYTYIYCINSAPQTTTLYFLQTD